MSGTGSYASSALPARYSGQVTLGSDGRYRPAKPSPLERVAPEAGFSTRVPAAGAGAAVGAVAGFRAAQARPISATRPYINSWAPPLTSFECCCLTPVKGSWIYSMQICYTFWFMFVTRHIDDGLSRRMSVLSPAWGLDVNALHQALPCTKL